MALNKHERDVINALILRVNDLTFEVQVMQVAGYELLKKLPFAWLRNYLGFNKWPQPTKYQELILFVDVAPIVEILERESGNKPNKTNIPGYYRRQQHTEKDEPFGDFEGDSSA